MFALCFKDISLSSVFLVKSLYEIKSLVLSEGFKWTQPVSIAHGTALKEYLCTCVCCVCDFKIPSASRANTLLIIYCQFFLNLIRMNMCSGAVPNCSWYNDEMA